MAYQNILGIISASPEGCYGAEILVSIPEIYAELYGTVDQWAYVPKNHTLYIWEFKCILDY